MDSLQEVIHSLDAKQQSEFVYFIQRNKYRKGRKDLQLFNLLKQEINVSAKEIAKHLKTPNLNAYHTIRKRLFNHLADFIILKSTSDDASTLSHVNGMLGVVSYLFDKGLYKYAWKYLLIAENLANEHHYNDVLNSIYLLQIEKAHLNKKINLEKVITNYQENQVVLKQNEKLQIASSLIRAQLDFQKERGIDVNFQVVVNDALDKLSININVLKTPRIVLEFIKIIRAGIIAKKDFNVFEPFLISNFNRLYKNVYHEVNPVLKSEFLYLIAHTSYRNKKFKQSLTFLEELSAELSQCSKAYLKKITPKLVQLKCANLVFLDGLSEAKLALNGLLEGELMLKTEEKVNSIINLGIYEFFDVNYKASQQCLNALTHSDNWYRKTMGVEWVLKKNLMEILLFIDM